MVSNGTVYDTRTKLTWQLVVSSASFVLADAKAHCASSAVQSALGGSGWRLPTVKELYTLVDLSRPAAPKIDPIFAAGLPGTTFWSSTPWAGHAATYAFKVAFVRGPFLIPMTHPRWALPAAFAKFWGARRCGS